MKKIKPKFLWTSVSQKAFEEAWKNEPKGLWESYLKNPTEKTIF